VESIPSKKLGKRAIGKERFRETKRYDVNTSNQDRRAKKGGERMTEVATKKRRTVSFEISWKKMHKTNEKREG